MASSMCVRAAHVSAIIRIAMKCVTAFSIDNYPSFHNIGKFTILLQNGDNTAQLLPNGMIAFYLQDGQHRVHRELVLAADKLRAICPQ